MDRGRNPNPSPDCLEDRWHGENPATRKTWENRSTLRSRWGKETDTNVYHAALKAEKRDAFGQTETGRRYAASRSPSEDLLERRERKKS